MTGAVLSGAIAAVDFDATKADVRRAVEDFLIILPRLRTPMLPAPRATLRLAAAIAGALLLPLPRGIDLGYAYQFLDDVADVVAGVAEVGKERGKDAGKCTAIDLFGVEGARRKAAEFQSRSLSHLERFGAEADWLRRLVTEASWKAS